MPFSIYCMEQEEREELGKGSESEEVGEGKGITETQHSGYIPPLIDLVIGSFAKKAIEIYDRDGYEAMDLYIQDMDTKFNLPGEIFLNRINLNIIDQLNRADIFASKLIELYKTSPEDTLAINSFFNNLDSHAKVIVAEWLIVELCDSKNFDENNINNIASLLEILFKGYHDIRFYDVMLSILSSEATKVQHLDVSVSGEADDYPLSHKQISYKWDDEGKLIILAPQDPSLEWALNMRELIQLIQGHRQYIFLKVLSLENTIKPIVAQLLNEVESKYAAARQGLPSDLSSLLDQYNRGDLSGKNNIEKERLLKQLFLMLSEYYPESLELIYYKNLVKILPEHMQVMSHIQDQLSQMLIGKLIEPLQSKNIHQVESAILDELYLNYAQFGLGFIDATLTFMIQEYLDEEKIDLEIQKVVLNNLSPIILKFAKRYGIDEDEFNSEFEDIAEKLDTLNIEKEK